MLHLALLHLLHDLLRCAGRRAWGEAVADVGRLLLLGLLLLVVCVGVFVVGLGAVCVQDYITDLSVPGRDA